MYRVRQYKTIPLMFDNNFGKYTYILCHIIVSGLHWIDLRLAVCAHFFNWKSQLCIGNTVITTTAEERKTIITTTTEQSTTQPTTTTDQTTTAEATTTAEPATTLITTPGSRSKCIVLAECHRCSYVV